jgi:hypothetical protein
MSVFPRAARARLAWISLALLIVAAIAGCTLKSGGYSTSSPPKLRFFNAAMEIGAVDISVGGILEASVLAFEGATTYRSVPLGSQPVVTNVALTSTVVTQTSQDFEKDERFTYILYGRPNSPQTVILQDNVELPGGGAYKIRLINVANESGPLDLYITSPGAVIDPNATANIANIAFGAASDYVVPNSGDVQLVLTATGTKTPIYTSGTITLSERNAYGLIAYNNGNPNLVSAAVITMDTLGSGQLVSSVQGQIRLVDAVTGPPAINMVVDGTTAIGGIPYAQASPYQPAVAGTHTVSIEATTAPGASLNSNSIIFTPGGSNTILAYGPSTSVLQVPMTDINLLPQTAGNARLRIVNANSSSLNVQTFINGNLAVGAEAPGQPSLYFEFPAGTYLFSFVNAADSSLMLDVPNVVLEANRTYTIYVMGATGAFTSLQTTDR